MDIAVGQEQTLDNPTEGSFLPLDILETRGVSKDDIEKLKKVGLYTLQSVAWAHRNQLAQRFVFSEEEANKIQRIAVGLLPVRLENAYDHFANRAEQIIYLTTGSQTLNRLLRGGIESGSITEILGESRTGKTQLCHTLAITCQLPVELGGANGQCLYIDTQGTFRPERLFEISQRYQLDPMKALKNVKFVRARNTDHQTALLILAAKAMSQSRFALIIVDSATALYRTDFSGRGELMNRQMHLGRFLHMLQKLTDEFGVAAVITNQVVAVVDGDPRETTGLVKYRPVGGNIMAHASTTRLELRLFADGRRRMKVYDSPRLPEEEADFMITAGGIEDVVAVVQLVVTDDDDDQDQVITLND